MKWAIKMFGRNIIVKFKGKMRKVFIFCNPNTPMEKLQKHAIEKLEKLNLKYGNDFEWAYEGMRKGYRV